MNVDEHGEIGRLVQPSSSLDMVILWAVYEVRPTGDGIAYRTSGGWIMGRPEQYFSCSPRERSLRPCILRAMKYAEEMYPGKEMQTH